MGIVNKSHRSSIRSREELLVANRLQMEQIWDCEIQNKRKPNGKLSKKHQWI